MKKYLLASLVVVALTVSAQASITLVAVNSGVTENFNGLINTGTTALTGTATAGTQVALAGTTFDGVKVGGTGASDMQLIANNGSSNTGALYSYGAAAGDTERALGSLASASNIPAYGVQIINNTGSLLTSVDLSFRREQWRSSTSTQNILVFAWGLSGGSANSSNYLTDASLTAQASCDLVGDPAVASPNGALDGNAGAVNVSCSVVANIPNGSTLFVRWTDTNDVGNDAGLAIDDLEVIGRPEPSTLALLGLGALALVRRRR